MSFFFVHGYDIECRVLRLMNEKTILTIVLQKKIKKFISLLGAEM